MTNPDPRFEPSAARLQELDLLKLEWRYKLAAEESKRDLRCVVESSCTTAQPDARSASQVRVVNQLTQVRGDENLQPVVSLRSASVASSTVIPPAFHGFDALKKCCDIVRPLPSWARLTKAFAEKYERRSATDAPPNRRETRAPFSSKQAHATRAAQSNSNPNPTEPPTVPREEWMPPTMVWFVEPNGDITIRDTRTGVVFQTIRRLKAQVRPTIIRHAPHYAVMTTHATSHGVRIEMSAAERAATLEQQLAHVTPENKIETDYVWVGFADGAIRLVSAVGCTQYHSLSPKRPESDFFLVHELPKQHSAEIVAMELSPYHPLRSANVQEHDHGNEPLSFTDIKTLLISSDVQPSDRRVRILCTASADSCVVLWDIVEVYTAIGQLLQRQRALEQQQARAVTPGPLHPVTHVEGLSRNVDPVYFTSHQYSPESNVISFVSQVAVRPLVRLKGSAFGLRHLKWASTIVTTEGYAPPRGVLTSEAFDAARDSHRTRKSKKRQILTRHDRRQRQMSLLGLTPKDLEEAERAMEDDTVGNGPVCDDEQLSPAPSYRSTSVHLRDEPVVSKCMHLLVAGDGNGNVMLWDMNEELGRTTDFRPEMLAIEDGQRSLLKQFQLDSKGRSTLTSVALGSHSRVHRPIPMRATDLDARSLTSHITSNAFFARTTDKRIRFSGGAAISGLEVVIPPVVRITLRRADPRSKAAAEHHKMLAESAGGATPHNKSYVDPVCYEDLCNEFLPLTESLAQFYMYENLEFFVAVDGSVQFLSCHPTHMNRESEDQLYQLLDSSQPNRIETKRGMGDEVVGSLEFRTFSVFFSKRVVEYHSQPVTMSRLDSRRSELWIARLDGMLTCFHTKTLKCMFRIPSPHATETIDPAPAAEVEDGLRDYRDLAGLPTQVRLHAECEPYPKGHFAVMTPLDGSVGVRLITLTNNSVNVFSNAAREILQNAEIGERDVCQRIQTTYSFQCRRLQERVEACAAAESAQKKKAKLYLTFDLALQNGFHHKTALSTMWKWQRYAMLRRERRSIRTRSRAEERGFVDHMAWSTEIKADAKSYRDERLSQAQRGAAAIYQVAEHDVRRRAYARWCALPSYRKRRTFILRFLQQSVMDKLSLRQHFAAWMHQAHLRLRSKQHTLDELRYQLTVQRRSMVDTMHERFMNWSSWATSRSAMRKWKYLTDARFHKHATAVEFSRQALPWFRRWVNIIRDMQRAQRRRWMGTQTKKDAADVRTIAVQQLLCREQEFQRHVTLLEGLVSEHALQCAGVCTEPFATGDVLSLDVSMPLADVLVNKPVEPVVDGRVLIWSAIEQARCGATAEQKALQDLDDALRSVEHEIDVMELLVGDVVSLQEDQTDISLAGTWKSALRGAHARLDDICSAATLLRSSLGDESESVDPAVILEVLMKPAVEAIAVGLEATPLASQSRGASSEPAEDRSVDVESDGSGTIQTETDAEAASRPISDPPTWIVHDWSKWAAYLQVAFDALESATTEDMNSTIEHMLAGLSLTDFTEQLRNTTAVLQSRVKSEHHEEAN